MDINLYDLGIDNGYGCEATLVTHGESLGECIVNATLEYIGNNGEEAFYKGVDTLQGLEYDDQIKVIDLIIEEYYGKS
jgi:hypothetical protein